MTVSTRHKWSAKVEFPPYKSERQCSRCEMVLVSRHENEGGRGVHWKEFYRDGDRVEHDATPPCDFRLERDLADNLEVTS
jgi:hypothetical protein